MGWVGGCERTGQSSPDSALPRSARWVTDPSVFVYPGLNVTRQLGPLIQHLCHHNMCHYLGAGHHFTSPLIGGVGRWGRNVTKTVLGEHFELRPRALHASDGGERGGNGSQTQQCGACEPAEEINLTERKKQEESERNEDVSSFTVQPADGEAVEIIPGRRRKTTLVVGLSATEKFRRERRRSESAGFLLLSFYYSKRRNNKLKFCWIKVTFLTQITFDSQLLARPALAL